MKTIEKDQTSIIKHEELYNNIIVLNGKLDEYLVQFDMQKSEFIKKKKICIQLHYYPPSIKRTIGINFLEIHLNC